jgi:hypothetical protein
MSTIAIFAPGSRAARVRSPRIVRLVLERGEICRLSRRTGQLCVRSGVAWLASQGRDYLLRSGESMNLAPAPDTLLSGIGDSPLVVELRG